MTYAEYFSYVKTQFMNADVSDIQEHLAYQFNITGESSGIFYVEVKEGKLSVQPYEYYDRNAIIHINGTNWLKLINGKLNPVVAFTTGKISVDGDVNAALEMIKYLG